MHHSSANHCSTTKLSGLPELSVQFSGPFLQRLCSGHRSLSLLQCSPQSGAAALCIRLLVENLSLHSRGSANPESQEDTCVPWAQCLPQSPHPLFHQSTQQLYNSVLIITQDALVSLVFMSAIPSLFIIITYFSFSIQHAQFTYFLLKLSLWPWLSASRIPGRCAYDYTLKCRKKVHNILGFSAYKSFYFADRVTWTPPPNFIFLKTDITRI